MTRSPALLAVLALAACRPTPEVATITRVTEVATPPASASAPPPAAAAKPAPSAEPSVAPFSEAVVERRSFRQISVGKIVMPGVRLDWTLERGARDARLLLACAVAQVPSPMGMSLDGAELDPRSWIPKAKAELMARRISEAPLRYRVSVVRADPEMKQHCGTLSPVFILTCRGEQVPVLAAGARLVVHPLRANQDIPSFHWAPGRTEPVSGLSCFTSRDESLTEDGGWSILPGVWPDWPLFFASERPIEWAFENSDMVVQQGAYRRLK